MLDIVIVSHLKELPILKVQAKSLENLLNVDIGKIIVINNDPDPTSFAQEFATIDYGTLAPKVELVPTSDLFTPSADRYTDHLIAKIKCHTLCTADQVLIMSSRDWFIREVDETRAFPNNKRMGKIYDLNSLSPAVLSTWTNSCAYFNVQPDNCYGANPPIFVGKAELAGLDASCDADSLIRSNAHSDSSLLVAYILREYQSWENYFVEDSFSVIFFEMPQDIDIVPRVTGESDSNIVTASIDRTVWASMSSADKNGIAQNWQDLGFFSLSTGLTIIEDMISRNNN